MSQLTMGEINHIINSDSRLQDCNIIDEIASGSFGRVYITRLNGKPTEVFALKVIDLKENYMARTGIKDEKKLYLNADFERYCQKAEQEFSNYHKFYTNDERSKHLVKIERSVEYRDARQRIIFILMPYFPGTLHDFQYFQPFNEDRVIDAALQCLHGLKTLHSHHICHRDIKPNNIFYILEDGELVLKIGDYGLSREVSYETGKVETATAVATPLYSAPEAKDDERSDIFSLAMTLYWLCNDYSLEGIYQIENIEKTLLRCKHGSEDLWHIIKKAAMQDPSKRYQSSKELYQAFIQFKNERKKAAPAYQLQILTTEHTNLEEKYQALLVTSQQYTNELNQLQQKLNDASGKNKELSEAHDLLSLENKNLSLKLSSMRNELDQKNEKISELNHSLENKHQTNQRLQREIRKKRASTFFKSKMSGVDRLLAFSVIVLLISYIAYSFASNPYHLAKLYSAAWFPFKNEDTAFVFYEKAAASGNANAMYQVAMSVIEEDKDRAMSLLETAASLNHMDALYELGISYYQDAQTEKAKEYLQKAIDLGSEKAANQLYEIARENKDKDTIFQLAYNYYYGQTLPQNYAISLTFYKDAAELGSAAAMNNIGTAYYNGNGVEQSYQTALSWYEKSANAGNIIAMQNIASIYYSGIDGIFNQDYGKAFDWYEKAANGGNKDAMNALADMYEKGLGVKNDAAKAQEWRQKAEE